MITVRLEVPRDIPSIRSVNEQAFGRPAEARLAERLHHSCPEHISLVADDDGALVGHIMFTPVQIKNDKVVQGMGLAPMAVLPSQQRKGIGTQLLKSGLQILQEKKCPFIIVLGHPDYYPRFGFQPASTCNIKSQWEGIPDDAFMILIMDDKAMRNVSGIATFRDEFNEAL